MKSSRVHERSYWHSLERWWWNSEPSGSGLFSNVLSKLGGVSSVSITSGLTSGSDDSSMNGARHTVALLDVNLWQLEVAVIVCVVILDISLGRSINHVSHLESLDGFVLWVDSSAVKAVDDVRMSLILLSSPVISSL